MATSSFKGTTGEHTPFLSRKKSYAMALITPNKVNWLSRLQAALQQVQEENHELKARLVSLKTRLSELETVAVAKVSGVKHELSTMATATQVQEVVKTMASKVESYVSMGLRERQLQEKNAFKVCVGGLPPEWDTNDGDLKDGVTVLNEAFQPIHIDLQYVESLSNKQNHNKDERIANGQAIITFTSRRTSANIACASSWALLLDCQRTQPYPTQVQKTRAQEDARSSSRRQMGGSP